MYWKFRCDCITSGSWKINVRRIVVDMHLKRGSDGGISLCQKAGLGREVKWRVAYSDANADV